MHIDLINFYSETNNERNITPSCVTGLTKEASNSASKGITTKLIIIYVYRCIINNNKQ
jgi:hypothetical protein